MSDEAKARELLSVPLGENDAHASTVRGYLLALLETLWQEEEGFSGKRPFGNSSWQYEIYYPMIRAGMVPGITLDGDDQIAESWPVWQDARREADKLILAAIAQLGQEGE